MKKFYIIFLFCFSLLFAAQTVRDFKLKDLNNHIQSYSKVKGEKLTLIDFWATWCKPCLQAIPKLNQIYKNYKNRGVEIIGINTDSPRNAAKVKPFAKTYKISYTVLRDPNSELATELNVASFPTLYIVNAENQIVYTHIGFRLGDDKILIQEIEKLLNENN